MVKHLRRVSNRLTTQEPLSEDTGRTTYLHANKITTLDGLSKFVRFLEDEIKSLREQIGTSINSPLIEINNRLESIELDISLLKNLPEIKKYLLNKANGDLKDCKID